MSTQTYKEYLKSHSAIKAFVFSALCLVVAINFSISNWTVLVGNPNYALPVLSILITLGMGIKSKTVAPIVIGSSMGVALTVALPELMAIAAQQA